MWRNRREFLRAFTTVVMLLFSFAACFAIIGFSWPEAKKAPAVAQANHTPHAVSPVRLEGAEIIPANLNTGSIQPTR
jgi:hypothetical protein